METALESPVKKKSYRRYVPGRRITPRQQLFADKLATGAGYVEAALAAGYKSKASAWTARNHPLVKEYLSSIQSRAAALVSHTVAIAMQEAKDGMEFARKTENATAYVKAVELRAKLSGLLVDRVEVFSMDLKGALNEAQNRLVQINPAFKQLTEAAPEADENTAQ